MPVKKSELTPEQMSAAVERANFADLPDDYSAPKCTDEG